MPEEENDLELIARKIKTRLHRDWDIVIAITGEEGCGKSSLAIQLGKLIDKNFDLEKNELFAPSVKEMKDKMINLPRYSVLICDEAVKVMYKLNWSSRLSIFMNQLYTLARKENKATLVLMPRFRDFNEYFRNHRIKVWIHVLDRGRAVMFAKDWSPFCKDPWYCDDNQKIIDKSKSFREKIIDTNFDKKIKILSRTKNFVINLEFDDLDEETKKEYKNLVDKNKYKDLSSEKIGYREGLLRNRLSSILKKEFDKGRSYRDLSREYGIPWETIRNHVSEHKRVLSDK